VGFAFGGEVRSHYIVYLIFIRVHKSKRLNFTVLFYLIDATKQSIDTWHGIDILFFVGWQEKPALNAIAFQ